MGVDRRENRRAGQGPSPRITHTAITHTAPLALVVDESPAARDGPRSCWRRPISTRSPAPAARRRWPLLRRCGDDVALVLTGASLSG